MKKLSALAFLVVLISLGLACDNAEGHEPKPSPPRIISLSKTEGAEIATFLEKRHQLIIAAKQLDLEEETLLTTLKKAHDLPATASVAINSQTGRLEESEHSSNCMEYTNGQVVCR